MGKLEFVAITRSYMNGKKPHKREKTIKLKTLLGIPGVLNFSDNINTTSQFKKFRGSIRQIVESRSMSFFDSEIQYLGYVNT